MAFETITPDALAARLAGGGETAVLDVRDEARFLAGHLLPAVHAPVGRLLDLVPGFVPRRATPLVLCDDGAKDGGLAEEVAERLGTAGYDRLLILEGGVPAWRAAGREAFETGYAMANCFGLAVEACYGTPRIDGAELMRRQAAGEPLLIVDSRPFEEFHAATVPGAINLPVAELFHRIADHLPNLETTVVVHCGGKTRGVLGCQSLINAGLANPVVALDQGTMDWVLAGGRLEEGAERTPAPPSETARTAALRSADEIARRFAVPSLSVDALAAWRRDSEDRTLYIVDVRSREEYEAGHLPDARWIPGGQLAGCTEDYIATRNARLCLVDDDGARAMLTASWMLQAGWPEVAVLAGGLEGQDLVRGPDPLGASATDAPADEGPPPDEAQVLESYGDSIAWRSGLLDRFARDGTLAFALPSQAGSSTKT
ncbi:MAG: rhodanese-like domain-containing protein [Kiloniellales bacterium]|nr:rhodanese-like domain-containing protein [Kiloniellales bacterium]